MKKSEYGVNTNLVRGGIKRSQFKETSEAIFFNSGFVYDTAEQAEAIFAGEETGFQYSRYANPTVEMFENRLSFREQQLLAEWLLFLGLICQLKQGDHLVSCCFYFLAILTSFFHSSKFFPSTRDTSIPYLGKMEVII